MGFITSKAHTMIGLIVGLVLILAPFLFGFSENAPATMVPIIIGIFIIINELITTSPASPIKLVPMKTHIIIDVLTGTFLAVSPWLFGFFDTENPIQWVPHVLVGFLIIGYALATTTTDERDTSIASS